MVVSWVEECWAKVGDVVMLTSDMAAVQGERLAAQASDILSVTQQQAHLRHPHVPITTHKPIPPPTCSASRKVW